MKSANCSLDASASRCSELSGVLDKGISTGLPSPIRNRDFQNNAINAQRVYLLQFRLHTRHRLQKGRQSSDLKTTQCMSVKRLPLEHMGGISSLLSWPIQDSLSISMQSCQTMSERLQSQPLKCMLVHRAHNSRKIDSTLSTSFEIFDFWCKHSRVPCTSAGHMIEPCTAFPEQVNCNEKCWVRRMPRCCTSMYVASGVLLFCRCVHGV